MQYTDLHCCLLSYNVTSNVVAYSIYSMYLKKNVYEKNNNNVLRQYDAPVFFHLVVFSAFKIVCFHSLHSINVIFCPRFLCTMSELQPTNACFTSSADC